MLHPCRNASLTLADSYYYHSFSHHWLSSMLPSDSLCVPIPYTCRRKFSQVQTLAKVHVPPSENFRIFNFRVNYCISLTTYTTWRNGIEVVVKKATMPTKTSELLEELPFQRYGSCCCGCYCGHDCGWLYIASTT